MTAAECTTYLGGQLGAGAWTAANDTQKEAALRMACERLERLLWEGERATSDQVLSWPRSGVIGPDGEELASDAVPGDVKAAQCWEAVWLLQWNARGAGDGSRDRLRAQGVTQVRMGDVLEAYGPSDPGPGVCPLSPMARAVVGRYLQRWASSVLL